jgi:hypothetical protein
MPDLRENGKEKTRGHRDFPEKDLFGQLVVVGSL